VSDESISSPSSLAFVVLYGVVVAGQILPPIAVLLWAFVVYLA
jgi:hypothetical protein